MVGPRDQKPDLFLAMRFGLIVDENRQLDRLSLERGFYLRSIGRGYQVSFSEAFGTPIPRSLPKSASARSWQSRSLVILRSYIVQGLRQLVSVKVWRSGRMLLALGGRLLARRAFVSDRLTGAVGPSASRVQSRLWLRVSQAYRYPLADNPIRANSAGHVVDVASRWPAGACRSARIARPAEFCAVFSTASGRIAVAEHSVRDATDRKGSEKTRNAKRQRAQHQHTLDYLN
jgi:hypothetical protein